MSFFGNLNNNNYVSSEDKLHDIKNTISILDLNNNDIFNKQFDFINSDDDISEKNDYGNKLFFKKNNSISNKLHIIFSKKTESETKDFLKKKINREKSESNDFFEQYDSSKELNGNKTIKEAIFSKPKGRKKKGAKTNEGSHSKFDKDNLMRKIKTFIFQCILKKLNRSFKEIKPQNYFYRLDKSLNENIKKDFNENLLKSKLKDIYKYPHLDNKYKKKDEHNRELIDKIYKEKTEIEVINILEKTFKDILNDIREKNLEIFLDEIRKKELKNNSEENVEKYIKAITNMLFYYEDWFDFKIERKPRNTNNK